MGGLDRPTNKSRSRSAKKGGGSKAMRGWSESDSESGGKKYQLKAVKTLPTASSFRAAPAKTVPGLSRAAEGQSIFLQGYVPVSQREKEKKEKEQRGKERRERERAAPARDRGRGKERSRDR